jgi:aspartate-semialdehyde dehydrogenase
MRSPRVAVVGATGAVGPIVLEVLHERGFPASDVVPFASARSAGTRVSFAGTEIEVRELTADALEGFDLALFSAGAGTSRAFAPEAVARGCVVVDKSSAFRLEPGVPLLVPEVNADAAAAHRGIVSNPNCSTIQLVCVLAPLHAAAGLEHVTIATYQAVSGTGARAVDELRLQSRAALDGDTAEPVVYPHQIAFNAIPHCDGFEGDSTLEERKLVLESQKILGDDAIGIHATCVRVPVWRGHSEAVWIETRSPLGADEAREILRGAPGVRVVDDPGSAGYPLASDAAGVDDVLVGRIRRDPSRRNGLALWIVADNLRKGAATNGVQIAELLVERDLVRVPGRAAA